MPSKRSAVGWSMPGEGASPTWRGRVCVHLLCSIAEPMGPLVTDDLIMGADEIEFDGVTMRFERLEEDMVSKLLALSEAEPEFGKALHVARCVREQVDWAEVRRRTQGSPFARAFFEIADSLEITERAAADEPLADETPRSKSVT